jgi:hypothetical protein
MGSLLPTVPISSQIVTKPKRSAKVSKDPGLLGLGVIYKLIGKTWGK